MPMTREEIARRLEEADRVSGFAENMVELFPQFDHIVLLSAPVPLILQRLATRTDNPYGRRPQEAALVDVH